MNYRTISDLNRIIREKIDVIPRDVELVVGIPRSGMLPATLIALYLNIPLVDLYSLSGDSSEEINLISARIGKKNLSTRNIFEYRKILVVDDSSNTGRSIQKAHEYIESLAGDAVEVIYSCVFATDRAVNSVDLYFEICNQPRMFEWNIMNHPSISASCFDMDGVLCVDPTSEQNDDGEKYIDFILNAKPLFIPTFKIGAIVTSRLEKYRCYTEQWLHDNGIQYDNLVMLNLASKEERIRLGAHSVFKAKVYNQIENAKLFYESNPKQARDINLRTNKPVYCVETNEFFDKDVSLEQYFEKKKMYDEIELKASEIINYVYDALQNIHNGELTTEENEVVGLVIEVGLCLLKFFEQYKINNDFVLSLRSLISYLEGSSTIEDKIRYASEFSFADAYTYLYMYHKVMSKKWAAMVTDKAWNHELFVCQSEMIDYFQSNKDNMQVCLAESEYITKRGELMRFPYPFVEKYKNDTIKVFYDFHKNSKYVLHHNKKLHFPLMSDDEIRCKYNQILVSQDQMSPQAFGNGKYKLPDDFVFVDLGAGVGALSLDLIEMAKRVYIAEKSDILQSSLKLTFEDYSSRVQIIDKCIDEGDTESTISIDTILADCSNENIIIRMDIAGAEIDALYGAQNTLNNNNCYIECASYHIEDQVKELSDFFEMINYEHETSDGYILHYDGKDALLNGRYAHLKAPFFRKALVRAWNNADE